MFVFRCAQDDVRHSLGYAGYTLDGVKVTFEFVDVVRDDFKIKIKFAREVKAFDDIWVGENRLDKTVVVLGVFYRDAHKSGDALAQLCR